ncbi:hypothetical protein FPV23_03865 [Carnobacterium sp. PL17RED31]|nr:hypothetical protein FPV23_03865 [Carnobacterium sp. PL17RED31]
MGLNAQKTAFIISRIKNGVEEVAQYNDYNGTIYWYSNRDSATNFEDLELAKGMLQVQDMMAKLTKQDVTFKLYRLDEETYEINADGERVVVEEETPVEETTAETA